MAGTVLAYLDGGDGDNQRLAWAALAARTLGSRLGEWLLGGVSEHLLGHADTALFMTH